MFKTVRCDNGKRGWGRDKGEGEVVDQSRSLGRGGCVCKLFMTMSAAWRDSSTRHSSGSRLVMSIAVPVKRRTL